MSISIIACNLGTIAFEKNSCVSIQDKYLSEIHEYVSLISDKLDD